MTELTEQDLRSALEEIAKRAASNAEYRNRALEDSSEVLEEALGKKLPENTVFRFIELENGELGVRIPVDASGELSDQELEAVAGGIFGPLLNPLSRLGTHISQSVAVGIDVGLDTLTGKYGRYV